METETTRQADRPLRRSATDRVIAGVAGGIARRLDIPAWVVRVAFVVLAFGGGLGIALYVAGWLLITDDNDTEPIARSLIERIQDRSGWIGIAFVGLGVLIVVLGIDFIRGDLAIAVFIGVIGVMLYRGELGGDTSRKSDSKTVERPATHPTPASLATPERGETPPPKEPKPPSILGRLTIALALISSGVMAFFDYAVTTFDPALRHYLGLVLGVVGVGLIVGSVLGRARGLIFVGILVAPMLVLSPLADVIVGEVRIAGSDAPPALTSSFDERITSPAQLQDYYHPDTGDFRLDLSGLVLRQPRTVRIENGIGTITVIVPDRATTTVYAHTDLGQVVLYGATQGGFDTTVESEASGEALLTLDIDLDAGEIIVEER